jgi:hypothetical protein
MKAWNYYTIITTLFLLQHSTNSSVISLDDNLYPHTYNLKSDNSDMYSFTLIEPQAPIVLSYEESSSFLVRSFSPFTEKVVISLGKLLDNETFKVITDIGDLKLSYGYLDYLIFLNPSDMKEIPDDGGSDYAMAFIKTSWFGWVKEVLWISPSFHILPNRNRQQNTQKIKV